MSQIHKEQFVCIDCETTGLDPKEDRIIEIGAVRFTVTSILDQYETLINPERLIPETSIAIHNITDQMVLNKPKIHEVLPHLLQFIGKAIIVGHGVNFDIEIIASSADRAGISHTLRENPFLDTLRMARLYGDSPANSLEHLRRHFNIQPEGAHRAMNDVVVNVEVFKYLCKPYKYTHQIFDVLSKPIQLKTMPLGKHKGRPLKEVPLDYLQWAAHKDFDQDLLFSLRSEIKRRKKGNLFAQAGNPFAGL